MTMTDAKESRSTSSSAEEENEASQGLRALRHVYTATDPLSRKSVFTKIRPGSQTSHGAGKMAIHDIYGTFALDGPSRARHGHGDESGCADAAACDALGAGTGRAGGTACRIVDLAPRYECATHRGQNLDYAIVIEGSVVLTLDSGQETRLERGDVAVQRATNHAWRNPSETEWARMVLVLQDSIRP